MKKKHILLAIAFSIGLGVSLSSCSDYLSVERFFNDRQSEEKIFKSKAEFNLQMQQNSD